MEVQYRESSSMTREKAFLTERQHTCLRRKCTSAYDKFVKKNWQRTDHLVLFDENRSTYDWNAPISDLFLQFIYNLNYTIYL